MRKILGVSNAVNATRGTPDPPRAIPVLGGHGGGGKKCASFVRLACRQRPLAAVGAIDSHLLHRHDEIALVLPTIVVRDDYHRPVLDGLDGIFDRCEVTWAWPRVRPLLIAPAFRSQTGSLGTEPGCL
ncbi:MAG TPA: hypothetical protein VMD08_06690 [Candidatus Baltobacteraceae bacterium]|nr:hypothetical protein [Candidatus Baltobacteraceae bacterium]